MKSPRFLLLILQLVLVAGCYSAERSQSDVAHSAKSMPAQTYADSNTQSAKLEEKATAPAQVSLKQADQSQ